MGSKFGEGWKRAGAVLGKSSTRCQGECNERKEAMRKTKCNISILVQRGRKEKGRAHEDREQGDGSG